MSEGVKYDEDKLDYTLLPQPELAKVVETLMYGANKYPEAHNWLKVPDGKNRYIKALLRHAMQAVDTDLDSESGLPHLAHAACCCLFAMHFMSENKVLNESNISSKYTVPENLLRDYRSQDILSVPLCIKKNYYCVTCGNKECECPVN